LRRPDPDLCEDRWAARRRGGVPEQALVTVAELRSFAAEHLGLLLFRGSPPAGGLRQRIPLFYRQTMSGRSASLEPSLPSWPPRRPAHRRTAGRLNRSVRSAGGGGPAGGTPGPGSGVDRGRGVAPDSRILNAAASWSNPPDLLELCPCRRRPLKLIRPRSPAQSWSSPAAPTRVVRGRPRPSNRVSFPVLDHVLWSSARPRPPDYVPLPSKPPNESRVAAGPQITFPLPRLAGDPVGSRRPDDGGLCLPSQFSGGGPPSGRIANRHRWSRRGFQAETAAGGQHSRRPSTG